jgi:DNA-binding transcriptional regulator YhcF (GntR family)
VTVLRLDPLSDIAPYEQVRRQVAALVAGGDLVAGEKLPTVRQLARDLGLAVNTVARAYRELESDGVISTHGRRGTFVKSGLLDGRASGAHHRDTENAAAALARTARASGLTLAETVRLVEAAWARRIRPAR